MDSGIKSVRAIVMPVCMRKDRKLDGGVFTLDGRPVASALHVRSKKNDFHVPSALSAADIDPVSEIDEPYLYGGVLFNHFGHFLIESLGRLWAAHTVRAKILFQPLWGKPDLRNRNHYIAATLAELAIDPARITLFDGPMRFVQLLIPDQLYGFYHLQNPDPRILDMFRRAGAAATAEAVAGPQHRRSLYVSRSRLDIILGRIAGEEEFEQYMRQQGYEIMYPEQLTFPEQMSCYRAAERVVFCEGSAIYAALLLLQSVTKFAVIVRRPGYDGAVRTFFDRLGLRTETIDEVQAHEYYGLSDHMGVSIVDFLAVSERLVRLGFVDSAFKKWPELKSQALRRHYSRFLARAEREPSFVRPSGAPYVI